MKFRIFQKAGQVQSSSIPNKFDFHPAHVEKIEIIQKPAQETIKSNEEQLKNDEPITAFEGNSPILISN